MLPRSCGLVALVALSTAAAQIGRSRPPRPRGQAIIRAANPADVRSPDAILSALYDVISGPAGKERDWERFHSLFLPGARLIPTAPKPGGGERARVLTPDGFIAAADPYFEKNGFYETEVARQARRFGGVMQVFSTYESRHSASDTKPFARGINSIELFFDGKRWWVVTVFWQPEGPSLPLPKRFLPRAGK